MLVLFSSDGCHSYSSNFCEGKVNYDKLVLKETCQPINSVYYSLNLEKGGAILDFGSSSVPHNFFST